MRSIRYVKLLLWPLFLCYDYSMDAVPLVDSATDLRLLLPLSAYSLVALSACRWVGIGSGSIVARRESGVALRRRRVAALLGFTIFTVSPLDVKLVALSLAPEAFCP